MFSGYLDRRLMGAETALRGNTLELPLPTFAVALCYDRFTSIVLKNSFFRVDHNLRGR
jgi:hypothetical protein